MRPETITLAIEEKYTPEEKAEIAGKLAIAIADLETISGEKKVSDAAYNERIKRCDGEITTLAKQYNKGCETAMVGCDIRYDHPEVGKKSYFRMDRNELVSTHDMSWEEKQETIQFPLGETTATASDAAPAETPSPLPDDLEKAMGIAGEEVTRLCAYPHCILFADHDGDHELRITEVPPDEHPQDGANL
jgi:hypothetical protein